MPFKKDREYWFNRTANVARAVRFVEDRLKSGIIPADAYRYEQAMTDKQRVGLEAELQRLKKEQVETHREFIAWNSKQ